MVRFAVSQSQFNLTSADIGSVTISPAAVAVAIAVAPCTGAPSLYNVAVTFPAALAATDTLASTS